MVIPLGTAMGFFDRLLGRQKASGTPERETPLSLQVLFSSRLRLNVNTVGGALRGFDPSLAEARFELGPPAGALMGAETGLAQWGRHAVQAVVFGTQMPSPMVERCVAPAHYGAELKAQARAHVSHAVLFYMGAEEDPLEQYVALAKEGALVVLNESAHTSFPAQPLIPEEGEELLDLLRTMPLTALYVGFVKLEVPGEKGVWMRTYGAEKMRLPDLAWHARSHDEAHDTFELFSGLLEYLRSSGARFADGHTAEWNERHVRIRVPSRGERKFLDSPGELFVLEPREPPGPAR